MMIQDGYILSESRMAGKFHVRLCKRSSRKNRTSTFLKNNILLVILSLFPSILDASCPQPPHGVRPSI